MGLYVTNKAQAELPPLNTTQQRHSRWEHRRYVAVLGHELLEPLRLRTLCSVIVNEGVDGKH